jgi:hypothetical protein
MTRFLFALVRSGTESGIGSLCGVLKEVSPPDRTPWGRRGSGVVALLRGLCLAKFRVGAWLCLASEGARNDYHRVSERGLLRARRSSDHAIRAHDPILARGSWHNRFVRRCLRADISRADPWNIPVPIRADIRRRLAMMSAYAF